MKHHTFICECGCEQPPENMIRMKYKVGKYIRVKRCCAVHKEYGQAMYRETTCDQCGVKIKVNMVGKIPALCKKHSYEKKKKYNQENNNKNYIPHPPRTMNAAQADLTRTDCKHRMSCLNKYAKTRYQAIPCKDCRKYEWVKGI